MIGRQAKLKFEDCSGGALVKLFSMTCGVVVAVCVCGSPDGRARAQAQTARAPQPVFLSIDPIGDAVAAFQQRSETWELRTVQNQSAKRRQTRFTFATHAILGNGDVRHTGGRAGHVLLRRPDVGSVGLYGSALRKHPEEGRRVKLGLEGEVFRGALTVGWVAGAERSRASTSLMGEPNRDEREEGRVLRPFSAMDARVYITPDFRISVGHRHQGGANIAAAGAAGFLRISHQYALLTFLDGRIGQGYGAVWAGLQLVSAKPGTLLRHERTVGATNWLMQDYYGPRFNPI